MGSFFFFFFLSFFSPACMAKSYLSFPLTQSGGLVSPKGVVEGC